MIKTALSFIVAVVLGSNALGQFAPQAGLPGSTAISKDSAVFTAWATGCTIQRGAKDIANPALGAATDGDSTAAFGIADGITVSLGDSGVATITFAHCITNGPGADFAVFENGFLDAINDSLAFLELAFVEVSSDGIHFFRFPASSLTPSQTQVGTYGYLNAVHINNLAGKYVALYGTPFDLQELSGLPGLDVTKITHVRIIDVIGDIGVHSSRDSAGNIINDPYPTPFPSCGFDLDAVGVIHQAGAGINEFSGPSANAVTCYPNPAGDILNIAVDNLALLPLAVSLTTVTGSIIDNRNLSEAKTAINIATLPRGVFLLRFEGKNGVIWTEKLVKL
jgi:Secretion system C-terminal sorting domain